MATKPFQPVACMDGIREHLLPVEMRRWSFVSRHLENSDRSACASVRTSRDREVTDRMSGSFPAARCSSPVARKRGGPPIGRG